MRTELVGQENASSAVHLIFNEIMQSNVDVLMVDRDFPDSWIELYNPTDRDINLKDYCLGTTSNLTQAYHFSRSNVIPKYDYAIICCDKKDDKRAHTNFRLESKSRGKLYLWNESGTLIDSLSYKKMPAPNVALGRISIEADDWQYEVKATPGETNATEFTDLQLPNPTFSNEGHLLTEDETAVCVTFNAEGLPEDTRLYVTTNGSAPDMSASCFPADSACVIPLDKVVTVVRARLISAHALPAVVVTHSYVHQDTSLPIFSFATDSAYLYDKEIGMMLGSDFSGNCYKNWRRPFNLEYFDSELADTAQINQLCEAGMHGSGSLLYSQKSLNLYANKRFGKKHFDSSGFWPDKPQVSNVKSFCLRNGGNRCLDDRFEDAFVQLLFGRHVQDLEYQAYRPVIAYINGEYKGIYGLRERSNEDWVESNMGLDSDSILDVDNFYSNSPYYDNVYALLQDSTATYEQFARELDMQLLVNYLCAEAFATNEDFPHNNVYLWKYYTDEDSTFKALLKDLDYVSLTSNTFNWFNFILLQSYEGATANNPDRHKLLIRLFSFEEFREAFVKHLQVYLGDFCKPSITLPMIEQMRAEVEPEIERTFSIMTEHPAYQDFLGMIENRLIPYCNTRPTLLCLQMAETLNLGGAVPLYVSTVDSANNLVLPIRINDIELTEGDFEGYMFSQYPTRLNTSNADYGWQLTVCHRDSTLSVRIYPDEIIDFQPDTLSNEQDIYYSFAPVLKAGFSIERIRDDNHTDNVECFDLFGRKVKDVNYRSGIRIVRDHQIKERKYQLLP